MLSAEWSDGVRLGPVGSDGVRFGLIGSDWVISHTGVLRRLSVDSNSNNEQPRGREVLDREANNKL